ncbi:hypothetical protein [Mycolicibacterium sp. CBMA 226]|uniref:hypothetical protein n=1 Tax=Mycolicibacterium sp. CBMA 226 TaxID=2606611 RepID=UPI0012DF4E97|nr:hypothetical protein [Mycolicibacterium sp. CBMA 226]MUL78221.1 hypothetical protein [Mycolicibacterium sp. CBMA 226]
MIVLTTGCTATAARGTTLAAAGAVPAEVAGAAIVEVALVAVADVTPTLATGVFGCGDEGRANGLEPDFACPPVEPGVAAEVVVPDAPEVADAPSAGEASAVPLTPVACCWLLVDPVPLWAELDVDCVSAVSWLGEAEFEVAVVVDAGALVAVFGSVWVAEVAADDADVPLEVGEPFDALDVEPVSAWAGATPNPPATAVTSHAPAAKLP